MEELIVFHEKHGDRYVSGDNLEAIMWFVCNERVNEGWYEGKSKDTALAALGFGKAGAFMQARKGYEYEDYSIPFVERA